jgi:hypothetical protein
MKKPAIKQPAVTAALSADAPMGKSQAYIGRALTAKAAGSMGKYQLWASLALELVGKAALARIHTCLVADPNSSASLFAAARMKRSISRLMIGHFNYRRVRPGLDLSMWDSKASAARADVPASR